MADRKTEDRSDEMQEGLHKLEDHIADAEKKLEARKEDATVAGDAAGAGDLEQGQENDGAAAEDPPGAAAAEPRTAQDVGVEGEGKMTAEAPSRDEHAADGSADPN